MEAEYPVFTGIQVHVTDEDDGCWSPEHCAHSEFKKTERSWSSVDDEVYVNCFSYVIARMQLFAEDSREVEAQRSAPTLVASEAYQALSDRIELVQELFSDLQALATMFNNDRTSCRKRRFSEDMQYLKVYIDAVLLPVSVNGKKAWREALDNAEYFLNQRRNSYPERHLAHLLHGSTSIAAEESYSLEPDQAYAYYLHLAELETCVASLEADLERIASQQSELLSIGGSLDEEERKKEEEQRQRRSLWERLAWSARHGEVRAQVDLQYLLILCKSSKFPDGDEPSCMTMPWNILPALVVLWGVCWMFYYSHGCSGSTLAQTSDILGLNDLFAPEWPQLLDLDYSDLNGVEPLTTNDDVNPGNAVPPDASGSPMSSRALSEHLHVDPNSSEHMDIPYFQGTGSDLRFAGEHLGVAEGEVVPFVSMINDHQTLSHNTITEFDHCNPVLKLAANPDSSSISATRTVPLSTRPSTCPHTECSELKFNDASEVKRHDARVHNRFECKIAGCDQTFGAKGDLSRHLRTKHNQLPLDKRLSCPETGCRYSRVPHFKRKDHLINHLKSMHNFDAAGARARAGVQASVRSTTIQDVPEESHSTSACSLKDPFTREFDTTVFSQAGQEVSSNRPHVRAAPSTLRGRVAKRNFQAMDSCAPETIEQIPETLAMWRYKAFEYKAQAEEDQSQCEALRRENESLKGELERLKKCEESLIAAVKALANR